MRISRRGFLAACAAEVQAGSGCCGAESLIDLGASCLLPESLAGFRSAMADNRILQGGGLLIPGAGRLSGSMAGRVHQHLKRGGRVLLESAAGLADQRIASPYVPYVEFTWPVRARIREFYPLPLYPRKGEVIIATFAHHPVALRRGGLILLGSPVGPALLAGDEDAQRWVASVLRWMQTRVAELL